MSIRLALLLTPIAALLAACATPSEVINQRLASVPEAQRAYIVGTYAVECGPNGARCDHAFNSITTFYRTPADKEVRGRLYFTTGSTFGNDTVADYTRPDQREKGFFFCTALPVGPYEVYSYNFYNFAGGGSGYNIRQEDEFKLPFTLAPGEVVDIGKLQVTTTAGKNIFGMTLPAPGLLLLARSTPAETQAALAKCPPAVQARSVRSSPLVDSGFAPTPFVQVKAAN